jgi:hypothetical protein
MLSGFEQLALKYFVYDQLVEISQPALEEIVELGDYRIEQGLLLNLHLTGAGFCDGLQLHSRRGRTPTGAVAACNKSSASPQPYCRSRRSGYRVIVFSSSSACLLAAAIPAKPGRWVCRPGNGES